MSAPLASAPSGSSAPAAPYRDRARWHSGAVQAAVYIAGWYFFSTSISLYNKWMFGPGLDFKFPIIITAFHQLCLFVLSAAVLYGNRHLVPKKTAKSEPQFASLLRVAASTYVQQIVPCAVASAGDIGLSNVSFRFISLSLYTMLKTSSLIFVLLFGILFRLEKFHWNLVLIVLVMSFSVLMMVNTPESASASENTRTGVFLVLLASTMSGLRWSFTQLLLKNNPLTPNSIVTIFYLSPAMCAMLFVCGVVIEGWSNFTGSVIWEVKGVLTTIVLLIIPGVLAFMMTLCEFKLLTVAAVITLSVAGIFKELLTIFLSSLIFGDRLSAVNVLGVVITFMDILWYNWFRYSQSAGDGYMTLEDVESAHEMELRKL